MKKDKLMKELRDFPKDKKIDNQIKDKMMFTLREEMKKDSKKQKGVLRPMKKLVFGIVNVAVVASIIFLVINVVDLQSEQDLSSNEIGESTSIEQGAPSNEIEESTTQEQEPDLSITTPEPDVEVILENYKRNFLEVVEDAGESGKLQSFQTKKEVWDHFKKIMSDDLARWFAETYIKEEDGELWMRAMDGPIWFENDTPYEVQKVDSDHYKVIQEPNNKLLENAKAIYVLHFDSEQWVVKELQTE